MKTTTHLWLIRLYAVIVAIVVFGDILEGTAHDLVIALALLGIIVQSFFVYSENTDT